MVKSTTSKKLAIDDDDIGEEDKIKEEANASIRDGRSAVWNDIEKLETSDKNETKAKSIRICFTSDNWRNDSTQDEYNCITAHWIDVNWKLQKRIIRFGALTPPFDGISIAEDVSLCLAKWKIDGKVETFTLDDASYNKTMASQIKRQLVRNGKELLFCGEYFQIRCCCHIINLIVKDGLKLIDSVVDKIRAIGKHFRYSIPKKKKFYEIAQQTYHLDPKKRIRAANGPHSFLIDMVKAMQKKCNKYWSDYHTLLSCACVVDPRYKLKFVEYSFITLYGEFHAKEKVKEVKAMLCNLLREYRDVDGGGVGESDEVSHDNRTSNASFSIDNDRMANFGGSNIFSPQDPNYEDEEYEDEQNKVQRETIKVD
uniref:hAT-like transposase RNase-H fold domain-containing protein n=1 Tax=Chenopodium quinoa TaxID=63459 RepID=A0A803LSK2_CHEQI